MLSNKKLPAVAFAERPTIQAFEEFVDLRVEFALRRTCDVTMTSKSAANSRLILGFASTRQRVHQRAYFYDTLAGFEAQKQKIDDQIAEVHRMFPAHRIAGVLER